jgi:hypothetical protein
MYARRFEDQPDAARSFARADSMRGMELRWRRAVVRAVWAVGESGWRRVAGGRVDGRVDVFSFVERGWDVAILGERR